MSYHDVLRSRQRRQAAVPARWSELLLADIQPDIEDDVLTWRNALIPMFRRYHSDADMVSIAGDLVDRGKENPDSPSLDYHYRHLFADFDKAGWRREWLFTISGNHDYNYGEVKNDPYSNTYAEFLKYNPRHYYYTVQGNVVRIYMGDMYAPGGGGEITDYVVDWCERIIARHPLHCIVLYIHQPLAGTVHSSADLTIANDQVQLGSVRFTDMLTRQAGNVALVISGHLPWAHLGGLTSPSVRSHEYKHGAWHCNVGLHIPNYRPYPAAPMSCCRMEFTHGSRHVRVRRWNCATNSYVPSKEFVFQAPAPIQLSAKLSYDGRYQWDERGALIGLDPGVRMTLASQVARIGGVEDAQYVEAKPQPMMQLVLEDRAPDNMPNKIGPAIDFFTPGGGADEGDTRGLSAYGLAGRIAVTKTSVTDVNYSADMQMLVGTGPGDEASLLLVQKLRPIDKMHVAPNAVLRNYVAGSSWLTSTSAADNSWYGICWSPELGLFCAVATSGVGTRVMTSPDGVNWTIRTSAADNSWRAVCWSPQLRLFCAVAETGTGNRVMTSPDGIAWTARASASDIGWRSVCWSPELGLFCAVSISGSGDSRVMTSPDGVTWALRHAATGHSWNSVCWSAELGLFCAVAITGTGNRVMTSPDGFVWTYYNSAADNSWRAVCWSAALGLFCAVAETGTGDRVMTSPDGMDWSLRASAADNPWWGICWSPELGLFCAVAPAGSGNRLMISPDGITWTTMPGAVDNNWYGVCWSRELGLFCAVAITGTNNRAMTSVSAHSYNWRS